MMPRFAAEHHEPKYSEQALMLSRLVLQVDEQSSATLNVRFAET